jgi:hypothetical protein
MIPVEARSGGGFEASGNASESVSPFRTHQFTNRVDIAGFDLSTIGGETCPNRSAILC